MSTMCHHSRNLPFFSEPLAGVWLCPPCVTSSCNQLTSTESNIMNKELDAGATLHASPKRSRLSNKNQDGARPYEPQLALAIVLRLLTEYVPQYIDTTD